MNAVLADAQIAREIRVPYDKWRKASQGPSDRGSLQVVLQH